MKRSEVIQQIHPLLLRRNQNHHPPASPGWGQGHEAQARRGQQNTSQGVKSAGAQDWLTVAVRDLRSRSSALSPGLAAGPSPSCPSIGRVGAHRPGQRRSDDTAMPHKQGAQSPSMPAPTTLRHVWASTRRGLPPPGTHRDVLGPATAQQVPGSQVAAVRPLLPSAP